MHKLSFVDFGFAVARVMRCWGHGQVIWTRHNKWFLFI